MRHCGAEYALHNHLRNCAMSTEKNKSYEPAIQVTCFSPEALIKLGDYCHYLAWAMKMGRAEYTSGSFVGRMQCGKHIITADLMISDTNVSLEVKQ